MLAGKIKYGSYSYTVQAIDTIDSFSMFLESLNYESICFMCTSDTSRFALTEDHQVNPRRVDISTARLNVEYRKLTGDDGKKLQPEINTDLFCRIGAIFRWCKNQCKKSNQVGYDGLTFASEDISDLSPSRDYIIKDPMDDTKEFASITLTYGAVSKLDIVINDFEMHLWEVEVDVENCIQFGKIENKKALGFAFNEAYLGFQLPVQEIQTVSYDDGMYHSIEEIIKANPNKEFEWLLGKDYQIVNDANLDEIIDYIYNYDGYVYYDTETTGLNINFKSRIGQADQCVGIILSVKYGESFYFPMQMKKIKNLCGGDHNYFMEHYVRKILEGKEIVAHNMAFDWKVSYIYDINANIVHDTMAMLALTLATERDDYPTSLKANAKLLLNRDSLELSDLVIDNSWGESDIKFWDLPEELVKLYACADTDNTMGLLQWALQTGLLEKYGASKVYDIEVAFSLAVAYQEFYGHRLDINHMAEIRKQIGQGLEETMAQMVAICGHEFNPNSPKQLLQVLYSELGIPEQISRKTGRPTTDKETLKKLSEITDEDDNIKYPFVALLQKYREYEGVRKIADKFPEHMTDDGYIFSSVYQYGTTTGRVSIHEPNYQSYNDPIKKNIVPRPGYYMFDTDYSSIEYRVLGNMVGNKKIMESFKDPDFDYHQYQAARMYGIPYANVTKKMRKSAKGINFGLPYGMGDQSLGVRIFGEETEENTRKAAALRAAYFKGQEDIRDWFEQHRTKGVKLGYTETYFGRRRYYRKDKFTVNAIRRQAGNQVIQGCISGDTRIHTKEYGIVKIKDVAGLKAHVWNGYKWSDADILYSGKKQKCVVTFSGGQKFVCSPQHKFLVCDVHGREHWVEAQNLKIVEGRTANSSHVKVNYNYEPSDKVYSSDWVSDYVGSANNAKNIFLENIENSFDIGVMLGRLASDGSYYYSDDRLGHNYLTHFVAEHEYNILPELRHCLESLGYKETVHDRKNEGKKEITQLTVYAKSLVKEISELDIKHRVHDNIFMDSEVLRGFLSGFFDGDGGISGKTISLTFGMQYDFEPMCLDIQKALLFFGIRSRYRKYDDRHVIQIKVNDCQKFCDEIGFLNQNKQNKGLNCYSLEQEKTFGHCIVVSSVVIEDEYIDMYDVCNTDDGYYVADGIITHNTAADLYKLAVGRVFKRICKEGWLGKVLFVGFIHDELLGEVSNDINPAVFLKMLREEFEVKVTNVDGSPWSPLYMGFGYGMSWYEAKSVELPIKYQWEIVEKFGETGFPEWTGDGRAFCDTVPDKLKDFEVRDIRNQLLDPENQGKEIKPTLNNQVLDCVKDDAKNYTNGISDYIQESGDFAMITSEHMSMGNYLKMVEKPLLAYLDKHYHIQSLYKDEQGQFIDSFTPAKTTQEAITQYCMLHATDRSVIDIKDIADVAEANVNLNVAVDMGDDGDDVVDSKALRLEAQLQTWGTSCDFEAQKFVLVFFDLDILMNLKAAGFFINKEGNENVRGLPLYIRDLYGVNGVKNVESPTDYKVPEDKVNLLREFILKNLNVFINRVKAKGIEV